MTTSSISSCKVGPDVGFKPTKQVYQSVAKKNGATTGDKKKQVGLARQEVRNSNPFDALNSVKNDDDLDGKLVLVDDDGKPFKKGDSLVYSNNDSEIEEVFNETSSFMVSTSLNSGNGSGYGTKSLLEQTGEIKVDVD
ncbi:hypothetical protein Tco_1086137 [Tanacetum coccineum]